LQDAESKRFLRRKLNERWLREGEELRGKIAKVNMG